MPARRGSFRGAGAGSSLNRFKGTVIGEYERTYAKLATLFSKLDGADLGSVLASDDGAAQFMQLRKDKGDQRISKAEWNAHLSGREGWDKLNEIMSEVPNFMETRFGDADGDGDVDLDDVWYTMDYDRSGDLTFDEFVYCFLDRTPPEMEAFEIFMNDDGVMPTSEVGAALRSLGFNPSEHDVLEIVNKADNNADGVLDQSEWKAITHSLMAEVKPGHDNTLVESIKENFVILAKGDSSITTSELLHVATSLGAVLSAQEAEAMVTVVDANSDGNVDAEEFMAMRGLPGNSVELE